MVMSMYIPEYIANPPFPELLTSLLKQTWLFQVYSLQFRYLHSHKVAPDFMGVFPDITQLFPELSYSTLGLQT